ncbi:hypothetical protein EVAR_85720_1 [Eumeta japonica]|uniref:Uncharacterized protein n=1 Tax=Eumeta variegata TaxID=151549 RepID=A0A4C1Y549_EUMVA|nr:hypothetical protein EVAR_85720_1 [Eumeta japonica]
MYLERSTSLERLGRSRRPARHEIAVITAHRTAGVTADGARRKNNARGSSGGAPGLRADAGDIYIGLHFYLRRAARAPRDPLLLSCAIARAARRPPPAPRDNSHLS